LQYARENGNVRKWEDAMSGQVARWSGGPVSREFFKKTQNEFFSYMFLICLIWFKNGDYKRMRKRNRMKKKRKRSKRLRKSPHSHSATSAGFESSHITFLIIHLQEIQWHHNRFHESLFYLSEHQQPQRIQKQSFLQ
jgi:hypothetical protein